MATDVKAIEQQMHASAREVMGLRTRAAAALRRLGGYGILQFGLLYAVHTVFEKAPKSHYEVAIAVALVAGFGLAQPFLRRHLVSVPSYFMERKRFLRAAHHVLNQGHDISYRDAKGQWHNLMRDIISRREGGLLVGRISTADLKPFTPALIAACARGTFSINGAVTLENGH